MSFTFQARIQRKIYFSETNGFGVFRITLKGSQKIPTVVTGNLIDVKEGDFIEAEGEKVIHPRFGEQIKISHYKIILPTDREGMVKYLHSGRYRGLGKKTAEKIVGRFKEHTFDILEHDPGRLKEIRGVSRKLIETIKGSIAENRIIRDLTVKLAPHGIGPDTIQKIYREFQGDVFNVLQANPYILIHRIRGIGFRLADLVARSFGVEHNDRHRIGSGIEFVLSQAEQKSGHLYLEESELLDEVCRLLDVAAEEITAVLERMITAGEIVREYLPHAIIASTKNHQIEKAIARFLKDLSLSSEDTDNLGDVEFPLTGHSVVKLTAEQLVAVNAAVSKRITVITGGPGTGKTTIVRAIVDVLTAGGKEVLVAAPTGRAAKRIEEASMYRASTIHRLLKINPETRQFVHNESNPLRADTVIIDEFSMVDTFIFYSLLRAISRHTSLVIIGDKDQLPSVGPGNLLRDMIGSSFFDVIHLNRNFRQTESSMIIENAYRINSGEELVLKPYSGDLDFVFLSASHERQALHKALRIVEFFNREIPANSPDMQILAPMYRGECGIDNINAVMQQRFNGSVKRLQKDKIQFILGDKVMQLKNNYEKEVFNGEQGQIVEIDGEKRAIFVDYAGYVIEYFWDELDQITPSYAISIHKSQGSEYDIVVLILLSSHGIMLSRELFYTAVTRAKRRLFLISDSQAIHRAIANVSPQERRTLLPERLREVFQEPVNSMYSLGGPANP